MEDQPTNLHLDVSDRRRMCVFLEVLVLEDAARIPTFPQNTHQTPSVGFRSTICCVETLPTQRGFTLGGSVPKSYENLSQTKKSSRKYNLSLQR